MSFYEIGLRPLLAYNCTIAVPALLLNCLVFLHYTETHKNYVSSMYLLITSCDCVMVFSLLLQHILLELSHQTPTEANSIPIMLASTLISVSYRCSVFANVVLAVSRTIQVSDPFYQLRKSLVYRAFAFYLVFWLALATYDVIYIVAIDYFGHGIVRWQQVQELHTRYSPG